MKNLWLSLLLIVLGEPTFAQKAPQWILYATTDKGDEFYLDYNRVKRNKSVFSAPVTIVNGNNLTAYWLSVDCRTWQFAAWQNNWDYRNWSLIAFESTAEAFANKLCK